MPYTSAGNQTVELGGLRFRVTHRSLGDDGGPTISVDAELDGAWTEVLRFDCFRKVPHYHAPAKDMTALKLDPAAVGDGLDWALAQVRDHLPEMLTMAGYPEVAQRVDRGALASGWTQVRDAVAATAPSS